MNDDYILYHIKEIDLHGLNRYEAKIAIDAFIHEEYNLKSKYVGIIHGKGEGILKDTTSKVLKENKYVKDYKLDIFNQGRTIAQLKK